MTTWYQIQLNCPVCEKVFKSSGISSCGYASKRTDFRPNYWGFNPVTYFYHLCPNCGFCSPQKYFESTFDNPAFQEEIFSTFHVIEQTLPKKIERAIRCLELMNKFGIVSLNEYELANHWLEAFWWANEPDQEIQFGKIAIDYFQKAINKDLIPKDLILVIHYLIAEIHRRIGLNGMATELFDKVISMTEGNTEFEWVHNLAIQQKTDPKDIKWRE